MRAKLAVMTVVMLLILPAQVMAQGDRSTGNIVGEVLDADGAGLPGATATIEGDNLIQESVSQVSDLAGAFRFRNLRPGTYVVTVSLTGFQTMAYSVAVNVGATASVIASLELAGVSETVTVVSETPLIDVESAALSINYTAELLENVPVARDFTDMTNFAPGFADKGAYGAGGNHAEGTSVHRHGAATNGYRLNGVDITENEWGAAWVNPNVDSIAEIQIVGIGASVEYSDYTGAMINLVTKGGTNEFHGTGAFYFQNGSLRSDNSRGIVDLERGKFSYDRDLSVTIGGPIVRNKALFFASAARQETLKSVVADQIWVDGGIAVEDAQQGNDRWTLHGRMDYLLNDSHTLGFMINYDPGRESNKDLRPGSPLAVGMDSDYSSTTLLLSWQSQWGDNTFSDFRLAHNKADYLRVPFVCCELPDYWYNGSRRITRGFLEDEDNARKEVAASVTQYVDNFLGAAHDVKVGLGYKDSWANWIAGYTGAGGMFTYGSYVYGSVYDFGLEGQLVSSSAFMQDTVTPSDNLTLNLGVRYDRTNGFERLNRKSTGGPPAVTFKNLAPRVGATLDLSGNGRAVLHGSWGRFFEKMTVGFISGASGTGYSDPYQPYSSYFYVIPDGFFPADYDPFNPTDAQLLALQDAVFTLENQTSVSAATFPLDPNLKSLHTDVFNFGFQYEIARDWVAGVDYIHKDDRNMFRHRNTFEHVYTPFEYTSPDVTLADGTVVPGGVTQTLYSRPSGEWQPIRSNDDFYKRTHDIVMLTLDRRRTGSGLNFSTSLAWQNHRGTFNNRDGDSVWGGGFDAANNPNFNGHSFAESGPLGFSRKWSWKVLGNYRLPGGILAGMYFNLSSGRPWNLTIRHGRRGIPELLTATYSSTAIEPVRSRTWDSHKQLDLRLSKSFNMGSNGRLELMVDGFNMLNDFSPTGVEGRIDRTFIVEGGSAVGSPRRSTQLLPGRQFRLGARVSF